MEETKKSVERNKYLIDEEGSKKETKKNSGEDKLEVEKENKIFRPASEDGKNSEEPQISVERVFKKYSNDI